MQFKFVIWLVIELLGVTMLSVAQDSQHGKVPRDGFDLYYRLYGSGAPVVILSGGPGFDCDYVVPVAQEISKIRQAILVELRGTGRSLPRAIDPDTINLKAYIADIDAVRSQLKIERWTLLGHSAGAMLAMRYAAALPLHVESLVLVGSPPVVTRLITSQGDNQKMRLLPDELAALENPNLTFAEAVRIAIPGSFFDRSKAAEMAAGFRPESLHPEVTALLIKELLPPDGDLRPAFQNFKSPVLVVAGRQDPLDPGMQYETHLAFKNSTLELIPRCGHFPWIEQPNEFYRIMNEFLRRRPER